MNRHVGNVFQGVGIVLILVGIYMISPWVLVALAGGALVAIGVALERG